jgi:hypothetical protein
MGSHTLVIQEYSWIKSVWNPISASILRGVSKEFGEWYQKTNKREDTNKLTLLVFKIIAILHNTLLATFIKLLETVSIGLFRNRSQNRCHTFLDWRDVCKTCAFHDALQTGTQKEVHPPYSPVLVPADTSLFPPLKIIMKGAHFADVAVIQ